MIEKLPTDGEERKLKIESVITAYEIPEGPAGADMGDYEEDMFRGAGDDGDGTQKLEIVTPAAVSEKNGRVTVTYDDSEILGNPKSVTQVTYTLDEPHVVTVIRSGAFSSMFIVEEGRHNSGEYKMGPYVLPVAVYGRRVKNSVVGGVGTIELDFTVELSGSDTQRTRMKFTLS